jgi:hypothetical protein
MAFGEQYVGALAVEAKNIRYRKFGWPVDTWPVVSTITGCPGSDILVRV